MDFVLLFLAPSNFSDSFIVRDGVISASGLLGCVSPECALGACAVRVAWTRLGDEHPQEISLEAD